MAGEYIEDINEAEPKARSHGDQQILVAGEKDPEKGSTRAEAKGNQSAEYYKN